MESTNEKRAARPRGTDSARVIMVIETVALEGTGTENDPCRQTKQYWSLDGELLGTYPVQRAGDIEAASSTASSILM